MNIIKSIQIMNHAFCFILIYYIYIYYTFKFLLYYIFSHKT